MRAILARGRRAPEWGQFVQLPLGDREEIVDRLKDEVDRRVRSEPPAALEAAAILVEAVEHAPSRRPLALRGRAAAFHMNGQTEGALADYEAAAELYSKAGDESSLARVLRSKVDVLNRAGDLERALATGERARAIFERHGEHRLLAQLEVNLGNVHVRRGELRTAAECYARAHELFEAADDGVGRAFATFSLANLDRDAGRLDRAAARYGEAREAWAAAGLDAHVADCDHSLAALDARQGRYGAAILELERARQLYADHARPTGVPECDRELAEIHFRLDAWHDSLDCAVRASEGFAAAGYELEQGRALFLAGLARDRLGDVAGGLRDLEEAEEHFATYDNSVQMAALGVHRAALQLERGEYEQALPTLDRALIDLTRERHYLLADLARVVRIRALAGAGRERQAMAESEELLGREGHSPLDVLVRIEALQVLAQVHHRAGRADEELNALEAAVDAVESSYAEVLGADARIAFFRGRHEIYEHLAWNHLEAGRVTQALAVVEASRGRSRREDQRGPATDDAETVRERMDWMLSRRLDAELDGVGGVAAAEGSPTDAELAACETELLKTERQTERTVLSSQRATELEAVLAARLPGETIVAYVVSGRGAAAIVVDDRGQRAVPLGAIVGPVAALRDRGRMQIQKINLGSDYLQRQGRRLRASFDQILCALGDLLLRPLRDQLEPGPITIVPYGPLHGLPFHALTLGEQPLVLSHDVSYAPSIGALATLRGRARAVAPAVLVAGIEDERAPRMAREARAAAGHYPGRVESIESGALRDRLARGCEASLLHIAAHGSFRADHPLFSGLDLGGSFLTAYDLRAMRIDVDLVVLSGCETARQVRVAGEELLGLERALFEAGVRGVFGSLWPVLDEATSVFMDRFYTRLSAGATAREALAATQRETIEADRGAMVWGPFALVGDGSVTCPGALS